MFLASFKHPFILLFFFWVTTTCFLVEVDTNLSEDIAASVLGVGVIRIRM
jgi:hypothetical protein